MKTVSQLLYFCSADNMRASIAKKIVSILFLSIFLMKIVFSIAPLIIAHCNKQAVNAVIMQLEMENDAKSGTVKESTVKEYFTLNSFDFTLSHPIQLILKSMISVDHDKHIQAFYPPVPTPPPNC